MAPGAPTINREDTSMTEEIVSKPRREVWLQIALAVAKGLPEPRQFDFHPDIPLVNIYVDRSDDAHEWAGWCEAKPSSYAANVWDSHRNHGGKWGYSWAVRGPREPDRPAPTAAEDDLAEELVAALTPGASMPYVAGDLGDR